MRSEMGKRENRSAIRVQDTRGGRREGRALYLRSVTRGARIPRSFADNARSVLSELPAKRERGRERENITASRISLTCRGHVRSRVVLFERAELSMDSFVLGRPPADDDSVDSSK